MMRTYIGLDIGGTKILGSLYTEDGISLRRVKKKTKASEGIDSVLKQIFKVIDGLIEDQDEKIELLGIGAGSPGIIKDERLVSFSPNIPFRDFDLGEKIVKRYNVPFVLGNDVNVAMYGEWKAAHIVDAKNVLGIFVGTGVGGAIIINEKLYVGKGGAAEFGHMVVNPEGAYCGCGSQGCLEAYASKTGIQSAIRGQIRKGRKTVLEEYLKSDGAVIKSSSLKKAYEAEDSLAVEVIDRAVYYLGLAMGTLLNQFHPDLVILGGGIMEALGQDLIEGIKTEAKRHVMPGQMDGVVFELSHLSDDAGIYGAYELIRDHLTK
ncbi:ROK family protein [Fusibacter sp. JL216-2]|uniref:ROK family protein n=1 Tax=Fusibacter sp. JL216-2 TaxID=3071453 RepID=UPI003D326C0D